MATKIRPEVCIELGGKPWRLRFDLNAMVDYEEATGKSILGLDLKKVSVKDLRALIWASLRHQDKNLTVEEVGGWIDTGNMEQVARALAEAFKAAVPEGGEDKKEGGPLASRK